MIIFHYVTKRKYFQSALSLLTMIENSNTTIWLSGALTLAACSSAFILSLQRTWLHKTQQRDSAPLRFDDKRDYTQPWADDSLRLTRLSFGTWTLTALSALNLYNVISQHQQQEEWALTASYCAQFVSWLYAAVLVLVSRRHKFPSEWGWILNVHLCIFYTLAWCIALYDIYEAFVLDPNDSWLHMLPTLLKFLLGSDLVYTTATVSRGPPFLDENGRAVASINVASIFSFLYFDWITPLVHLAFKNQKLTNEDLPTLPPLYRGYNLYYLFGATRNGNSLIKRIYLTNKPAIMIQIVLAVVTSLAYYVPAFFVNQLLVLIQSMQGEGDDVSIRKGFVIVVSLAASILILGILVGQLWYYGKQKETKKEWFNSID